MYKRQDIKKGFTHFAEGDIVVAKISPCLENRKSAIVTSLPKGIGAGTTELFEMCIRDSYKTEFIATSMLSAVSTALGGTYRIRIKGDWQSNGALYVLSPIHISAESMSIWRSLTVRTERKSISSASSARCHVITTIKGRY